MTDSIYESPKSEVADDSDARVTLSMKEILFSFNGRIRRSTYWFTMLGMFVVLIVVMVAVGFAAQGNSGAFAFMALLYVPVVWISIAVQVKRWHDRDKSGWFVLVSFIPLIGPFWALIENGFLAGSDSVNRFGPPQA